MTWRQLKHYLALAGVKDDDVIVYIDLGESAIFEFENTSVQDPDGIHVRIRPQRDGRREVTIS